MLLLALLKKCNIFNGLLRFQTYLSKGNSESTLYHIRTLLGACSVLVRCFFGVSSVVTE